MKQEKSILSNALLYSIKVCTAFLFPIISQPYANKILGVDTIGKYNFSSSIVTYFASFAGLGISTYAIREGAKIRDDRVGLNYFSQEILSINFVSTVVSLTTLILLLLGYPKLVGYRAIILMLACEIPLTTFGTGWIFNILEDYVFITIRSVVFQGIALIMMFVFVKTEKDILWYAFISVIAVSGSNILNFIYARKYFNFRLIRNKNVCIHLKPILTLFASSVASQIYVNSDVTMLGIMRSDYEVGIYSAASKIYNLARSVLLAFIVVIFPRMSFYSRNDERYNQLLNKVLQSYLFFLIPVSVGLMCISDYVILLFCGRGFKDSVYPFLILCIAMVISSLGSLIANLVLLIYNMESKILTATLIGASVNIVCNLFAIPRISYMGTALTTLFSEIVVLIVQMFFSLQVAKIKNIFSEMIKIFAGCGIMISVCFFIRKLNLGILVSMICDILAGSIFYLTALLLMRSKVMCYITSTILKRRK